MPAGRSLRILKWPGPDAFTRPCAKAEPVGRMPAVSPRGYHRICSMRYVHRVRERRDWRAGVRDPARTRLVRVGREPGMLSSIALHAGELLAAGLLAGVVFAALVAAGGLWLRRRVRRRLQALGPVLAGRARGAAAVAGGAGSRRRTRSPRCPARRHASWRTTSASR